MKDERNKKIGQLLAAGFFAFALAFMSLGNAHAASEEAMRPVAAKLDRWDVEEAWGEVKQLLEKEPKDPQLLELASQVAFHRGDYQEALKLIKSAIALGSEDERSKNFALFMEGAIGVIAPLKRYESSHFVISLDEKQDGILVDYISDTLEKTHQVMAQRYGFQAKEKIRVEVFPDTRAFYYASTLSARDIEVTGAVGVTQFNKLMLLSPRALVYGYRWLDSMSHEYMHYLIMKLTGNKAPIWFHEGLAKYEETRWRSGPSYLSPLYQNLLARALSDGKLIKFERMEPSLVKLETPEDAQLAYAEAAAAIDFIVTKAGNDGLREIMKQMAASSSKGAANAIRDTLGLSFSGFEENWKKFLASKELKEEGEVKVRPLKIKEGRVNEEYLDMEEIKSLVARNRAHLGDLLKEKGRMGAAVLEYRRALAETRESVPIMNRLAWVLLEINRHEEALELLKRGRELSPDHPTIYTYLGQTYLKLKDFKEAKEAFQTSIQLNPFNPEVHDGLASVYEMTGDPTAALKEKEITRRLIR
jgi:tetratricopeptide (TPR) repeat protein